MLDVILTQNSTPIFKYIVALLGMIMNALFEVLNLIRIPNIGLSIILFTIVMYMLMLPITMKQQKFSKLSAKMNPEIQAIQAKYKNRRDNESMMAMNQETQAVYAKYGVSPAGSCLQLLITMPVLFALYRVIYSIPAYVTKIKAVFVILIASLGLINGAENANYTTFDVANDKYVIASANEIDPDTKATADKIKELYKDSAHLSTYTSKLGKGGTIKKAQNRYIDFFNQFNAKDWETLENYYKENGASEATLQKIAETEKILKKYNGFLGLNVSYSPSYIVRDAWGSNWLLVIGGLLIPLLAGLSQFINVKLMPQQDPSQNQSDTANSMASSMKVMNMIMPLISIFFCWSLQVGVGIYWIGSSVVRTIQQIVINKSIDRMDLDAMMKANIEKNNAKRAKLGLPPQTLNTNANINTKKINAVPQKSQEERDAAVKKSTEYYKSNAKPGSLAAKVNMVKQYNEKNNNK